MKRRMNSMISRTAFASLRGKPYPCYAIPLKAGMSIGMLLISVELVIMLAILLFIPGDYAGPCFIGDEQQNRQQDRKSTRLNSSHITISYAVFCLKKKNI